MAKKTTITKANVSKLNKVAKILQTFSATGASNASKLTGPVISITDIYTVGKTGNNVQFNLTINTKGTGASTNAFLHNTTGPVLQVITGGKDSLSNIDLGIDSNLNGVILKITTIVTATDLTPVPVALNVQFSMSGGQAAKDFPLPPNQFNDVGDSFIIDYTIIIFQA